VDQNQLWEFHTKVSGTSYLTLAEGARLPVISLDPPQQIVPGQRRRAARVVPSPKIKGWIRCVDNRGKAHREGAGRTIPIIVDDLSTCGARITTKKDVVISQFKWGANITCRLELPAPLGAVQVKGTIQHLILSHEKKSSPTVHLGIEFHQDERSRSIGLVKIREYLATYQRRQHVFV
jgi:hypothetical protein